MTIEEAKSILKEMLQKEGTFKQKNMVVVLTGLMGAGKTTLLCRLFGKEPPAEYNSSGVVERSWRGLTQYILDMNKLQLLDNHEDIFELVARVKKTLGKNELGNDNDKTEKNDEVKHDDKTDKSKHVEHDDKTDEINNGDKTEIKHDEKVDQREDMNEADQSTQETKDSVMGATSEGLQDESKADVIEKKDSQDDEPTATPEERDESSKEFISQVEEKENASPPSFDEMVRKIRENPEECHGELEIVHMIDTGGQPECLEIMPFLIQNANLILLVVNLSISLDKCTVPTFHKDHTGFEKRNLLTSNGELIKQLAQTVMAAQTETQSRKVKILIIATHKDSPLKEDNSTELEILAKDIFPHDSLYKDVIYVELQEPDEDTQKALPKIHKVIQDEMKAMKEDNIPPSFVMFEREATLHIKEIERKMAVLNLDECLEIGRKLHMKENVVKAALTHFHENNLFLMLENIGQGLVFLDPKTLLDSVNRIICNSYMVSRENGLMLTVEESKSLPKGVITEELMRKMNDRFVTGIFDPHDAITVFENIFVIARYSEAQCSESKYIMMCLLPRLSAEEIKSRKLVFTMCDPARPPLRIDFGVGTPPDWQQYCSPSGCFGGTIACLITKCKWKICVDKIFDKIFDQAPVCLYHDMAILFPDKLNIEVTLINKTKYFEVYVDVDPEYTHQYNELPAVRNEIMSAVEEVLKTMKVNLIAAEGFECDCESTKYLHEKPPFCKCGLNEKTESLWIEAKPGMIHKNNNLLTEVLF